MLIHRIDYITLSEEGVVMKDKLIRDIEVRLATFCPDIDRDAVIRQVMESLKDYDVTEITTDLTVRHEDINTNILKKYVACIRIDGKSEKTIEQYVRTIRKLGELICKPYTEMSAYEIRYYLATLKEKGNSNRSIENQRAYLSAFFQWMFVEEMIQRNPCGKIKPIKVEDKVRLPFSSVQLDAMRVNCKDARQRAMLELLVSSGVRCEEFCHLMISDVDLQAKTVLVRNGKGSKDRKTFMSDLAAAHLQKYLDSRKDDRPELFVSNYKMPYSNNGIDRQLKRIAERAGVENVHAHRFRRTFATNLYKRGMDVHEIQRLMGHTNVQTTLYYIYADDNHLATAYQKYAA